MGDQATDQNLPYSHQIVPHKHEILCMEIENDDGVWQMTGIEIRKKWAQKKKVKRHIQFMYIQSDLSKFGEVIQLRLYA